MLASKKWEKHQIHRYREWLVVLYQAQEHVPQIQARSKCNCHRWNTYWWFSSARILLSISCPEVNLVFMLILPTNKVYWMLAVLNIKDAYVTCIQLNQENIHTIMSRSILKLNRLSKWSPTLWTILESGKKIQMLMLMIP